MTDAHALMATVTADRPLHPMPKAVAAMQNEEACGTYKKIRVTCHAQGSIDLSGSAAHLLGTSLHSSLLLSLAQPLVIVMIIAMTMLLHSEWSMSHSRMNTDRGAP